MDASVKIKIRVTDPVTGKRHYVPVTGKKTDPQGFPYYTSYCKGRQATSAKSPSSRSASGASSARRPQLCATYRCQPTCRPNWR